MTGFSNTGKASGFAGVDNEGNPAGDLTGSYPNPLVKGLWDNPIDPRIPSNGDTLVFNGGEWIPTPSPSNTAALFKGVIDTSTDPPNPDVENYPGLSDGFTWLVQVAGTANIGGISPWNVGDYVIYSGGSWYKLSNTSFGWGLTGNAGTTPTVNYVGTNDSHELSIRANVIEGLRIKTNGDVTAAHNLTVTDDITATNLTTSGDVYVNGGGIHTDAGVLNIATDDINSGDTVNIGRGDAATNSWTNDVTFRASTVQMYLSGSDVSDVNLRFNAEGDSIAGVYVSAAQLKLYGDYGIQINGYSGNISSIVSNGTNVNVVNVDAGQNVFNVDGGGNVSLTGNISTPSTSIDIVNDTATTVNIAGGATSAVNLGNVAGTNTISGATKLPQGLSGSLTRLTDGKSAFVADDGVLITSASNGAVTFKVDNSKFASLTGSVFSGPVSFNTGLSGSLTKLVDGTSAFIAGTGILVSSASNGAVTITMSNTGSAGTYGSSSQVPVFSTDAQGRVTSATNTSIQINESQVTNLLTDLTASVNALNSLSSSLASQKADKTTTITAGVGLTGGGDLSVNRTINLSNTGSAGTYGTASQVPVFSTDAQGRVTAATNTSIAINASQVVAGTFPNSVSVQNIYQNVTSQVSGGSSPLAYGEVIYFTTSGGSAASPAIDRASAASAATAATTIGLVSSTTIPNGTAGQIITRGVLVGNPLGSPPYLNTNGFTQGDLLYVDPTTPGALTNVRPSYPNFAIPVGIVIVKNQYAGAIYVDPSVGYNAADIVKIPAPSGKRTDPTSTTSIPSTWFNGPPAVSYLALDFSGPGNVTLSAGPIQAQTSSDYGRNLWIHNVSTKTITFNAGGTAYLSGGVNLVLQPNSIVHFMWSFVGGGVGRWIQMGSPITVS